MNYVVIKNKYWQGAISPYEAIGVFNSLEEADAYVADAATDTYMWRVVPWKVITHEVTADHGVQTWRDLG
jgi:hypothetical protein